MKNIETYIIIFIILLLTWKFWVFW